MSRSVSKGSATNPLGLLVVSKESWDDIRWARKQWLPYYLSGRQELDRVLYLDRHRPWWRGQFPHRPYTAAGIEVRQQPLWLPLERCPRVRAWNRRLVASRVRPWLDPGHAWVSLYYHPFDVDLMHAVADRSKVVFDWTEDWAVFHRDEAMAALQRRAVEESDMVLTVTAALRDRAVAWRGSDAAVHHVPNATALELPASPVDEAEAIGGIPHPRIGFVGHAGPWFNAGLVAALAAQRPAWQWLMIGGLGAEAGTALAGKTNVHWLGSQAPRQLMSYLRFCDVLVAPYRQGIEGDATKLYDYLAAGRPVLSAGCETAERLQPWVGICEGTEAWLRALDGLLQGGRKPLPVPEEVVRAHHWRARAAVVAELLQGLAHG